MRTNLKRGLGMLAAVGVLAAAQMPALADITWNFGAGGAFSGTSPNSSSTWLTATLAQDGTDQVKVTLTWGSVPDGTKLVANGGDNGGFYLNFTGTSAQLSALTFTLPSGLSQTVGANAFKADGDGLYDILIGTGSAFTAGTVNTISFTINGNGAGITPVSFDTTSNTAPGNGTTWYAAAHIGGYTLPGDTQSSSVWAGAVPEPTTIVAGALLLLPFGASALRVLRKRS